MRLERKSEPMLDAGPWPFSSLVGRPGWRTYCWVIFGRAYLPDMLPEGVSSDAIR